MIILLPEEYKTKLGGPGDSESTKVKIVGLFISKWPLEPHQEILENEQTQFIYQIELCAASTTYFTNKHPSLCGCIGNKTDLFLGRGHLRDMIYKIGRERDKR